MKLWRAPRPSRRRSGPRKPSASPGSSRRPRSRTPLPRRRLDQMVRGRHAERLAPTASTGIWPTRGDQTAIIWEGDDPSVSQARSPIANCTSRSAAWPTCCKPQGVKKGDRVTIYLPMMPEAAVAMLACARIGAIHSVVFGGFSPDSLAGRIQDCDSDVADHRRRGPARRPQGAAEGQCRRGAERPARTCTTVIVVERHRRRRSHAAGPRHLVLRGCAAAASPTARPSR